MSKVDNFVGTRFGRLVVESAAGNDGHRRPLAKVRCDCGVSKVIRFDGLSRTKSCGCAPKPRNALKHGFSPALAPRPPEYQCWVAIRQRCYNERNPAFDDYGGRGIRVCPRWIDSFVNFLADVGRKPTPQHSIDRWPDNDGNYEPGNVRWATRSEQNLNRRKFTRRWRVAPRPVQGAA